MEETSINRKMVGSALIEALNLEGERLQDAPEDWEFEGLLEYYGMSECTITEVAVLSDDKWAISPYSTVWSRIEPNWGCISIAFGIPPYGNVISFDTKEFGKDTQKILDIAIQDMVTDQYWYGCNTGVLQAARMVGDRDWFHPTHIKDNKGKIEMDHSLSLTPDKAEKLELVKHLQKRIDSYNFNKEKYGI